MDLITSAGSKLYIATETTVPADVAAYDALTWTEVGDIEDLGELGDSYNVVTFISLSDSRVVKTAGAADAGQQTVVCGWDPDDAGQDALNAAIGAIRNFKVERDDQITPTTGNPTTQYYRALVSANRVRMGGNENVQRRNYQLDITSAILEKAAV